MKKNIIFGVWATLLFFIFLFFTNFDSANAIIQKPFGGKVTFYKPGICMGGNPPFMITPASPSILPGPFGTLPTTLGKFPRIGGYALGMHLPAPTNPCIEVSLTGMSITLSFPITIMGVSQ
jgi:hypothetical protein